MSERWSNRKSKKQKGEASSTPSADAASAAAADPSGGKGGNDKREPQSRSSRKAVLREFKRAKRLRRTARKKEEKARVQAEKAAALAAGVPYEEKKNPAPSASPDTDDAPAANGGDPSSSKLRKRKVALLVSYNGIGYQGLQIQLKQGQIDGGVPTIEAEVESALFKAGGITVLVQTVFVACFVLTLCSRMNE
jgi:hypothetical protein